MRARKISIYQFIFKSIEGKCVRKVAITDSGNIIISPLPILTPLHFQSALVHLCEGEIYPYPEWHRRYGDTGFLTQFPNLLDAIFYHVRTVLVGKPLENPIIEEFEKKRIIHVISDVQDSSDWEDIRYGFKSLTELDPRSFVLKVILNPFNEIQLLEKYNIVRGILPLDRASLSERALLRALDLERLHEISAAGDYIHHILPFELSLCLALGTPVLETTSSQWTNQLADRIARDHATVFLSHSQDFKERQKKAIEIVLDELKIIRGKIQCAQIEKGRISLHTVTNVPFSLALLLDRCKKADDITDSILDVRKDLERFRKWLAEFDEALKDGNLGRIVKADSELQAATQLLRQEYSEIPSTQMISKSYSEAAKDIFEAFFKMDPTNIIGRLLASITEKVHKRRYSHIYYIQRIGRAGINVSFFKKMRGIFGSEQADLFGEFLRTLITRDEVASKVLELPLSERAIINFNVTLPQPATFIQTASLDYCIEEAGKKYGILIEKDCPYEGYKKFIQKLTDELERKGVKPFQSSYENFVLTWIGKLNEKANEVAKLESKLATKVKRLLDADDFSKKNLYWASGYFKRLRDNYCKALIVNLLQDLGEI